MVRGALTAPAGKTMVSPVVGMEMVPPRGPISFETWTTSLCLFFHQSALRSKWPASGRALATVGSQASAAGDEPGPRGAVGLCSAGSEHDAMRPAARRRLKERKSLFITFWREVKSDRERRPP